MTASGFAQALVFGWLHQPDATRKQLHQSALECGLSLTPQGLDQRFTEAAVDFMRGLLEAALKEVVRSEAPRPLLPAFNGVYLTDSTHVTWGEMGLKLGVRLELQHGDLAVSLEPATRHDQKLAVLDPALPAGALVLNDLGFFKLERFQAWSRNGVYWLTRYKTGTTLTELDGSAFPLEARLQANQPFTAAVKVGQRNPVTAWLHAAPLEAAAWRKRQARLKEVARKKQRVLSPRQQALARWTLYLTNVPDLTFDHAHILARTRWQIELLFKLWKSHAHLTQSRSADPLRCACEGYAKLLALLVAHWLLLTGGWEDFPVSSVDALHLIQRHAPQILAALVRHRSMTRTLQHLRRLLRLLPRHSRRKTHPLAFQLWQAFDPVLP